MKDATMHKELLINKLNSHISNVGIVGLGYVGLPLAVAFAEAGQCVTGVDLDPEKVSLINSGKSYIPDIPTERLATLVEANSLRATTKFSDLADIDAVSICVPTPLRMTKDPDLSYVSSAADAIAEISHPGMLIVLERKTYPGKTEE